YIYIYMYLYIYVYIYMYIYIYICIYICMYTCVFIVIYNIIIYFTMAALFIMAGTWSVSFADTFTATHAYINRTNVVNSSLKLKSLEVKNLTKFSSFFSTSFVEKQVEGLMLLPVCISEVLG
uniref:Uncharacterized protein n=1 Tax=Parascaris univalens TaxID=6257 RepID=A0A914ZT39_PARUN